MNAVEYLRSPTPTGVVILPYELTYLPDVRELRRGNQSLQLSNIESDFVACLVRAQEAFVGKEEISEYLVGTYIACFDYLLDRLVEALQSKVRGTWPEAPDFIERSEDGRSYRVVLRAKAARLASMLRNY